MHFYKEEVKILAFKGSKLKEWLETTGLSQAAAAKHFEIAQAYLSDLINCKKEPSFGMLEKIATKTNIPISEFSTESAEMGNPTPPVLE